MKRYTVHRKSDGKQIGSVSVRFADPKAAVEKWKARNPKKVGEKVELVARF